ncbi:MAG TPA: ABC transporter substrate-binding protein [Candidatus Thioglobus sp.]|jgi:zinc transport system substrate-binding protein|nr:ABC transporter substrate-binding protein [Candidatus Thioglobus sp.]HIL42416.1 ABC transporter substrate-binding protein [Gammaproteobacteria bacterium]
MISKFIVTLLLLTSNVVASPLIVVTIKPIHSIVSALTHDISSPKLLLNSKQSAHNFNLKPSQLNLVMKSDLLIAVDNHFESDLNKIIKNIDTTKKIIITGSSEINLLPTTDGSSTNYHLWLDINNMKLIAQDISIMLIRIDQKNKGTYQKNLKSLIVKLDELTNGIKNKLANYNNSPIATYSDSFQYFIDAYELHNPVVVTKYHGDRLSIYSALKARKAIKNNEIKCMLSDKEVPTSRLNVIADGLNVNIYSIDIMGIDIEQGQDHYIKLMNTITNKVHECLQ